MRYYRILGVIMMCCVLLACAKKQGSQLTTSIHTANPQHSSKAVYLVAIHPLHNAQRIFELYQPLIELMNANLKNYELKLEAASDYTDFEKKLYAGRYHFALPNPLQSLLSVQHGYSIFGKVANDAQFRGVILVPKNSPIKSISDLKGKKVSYPSATALAACIMPQWFFYQNGINVQKDIINVFVGSQESSITHVATGAVDVGVTWIPPWKGYKKKYPEFASKLKVMWETPSMINNGWVVRNDVPIAVREQVAGMLFTLNKTEKGQAILTKIGYEGFEPASPKTYEPVRTFIKTFNAKVRPLEIIP